MPGLIWNSIGMNEVYQNIGCNAGGFRRYEKRSANRYFMQEWNGSNCNAG